MIRYVKALRLKFLGVDTLRVAAEGSFYLTMLLLLFTGATIVVLVVASYTGATNTIWLCIGFLRLAVVALPSFMLTSITLSKLLIEVVSRNWEEQLKANTEGTWEFELKVAAKSGFDISGCKGCKYLAKRTHQCRYIVCGLHPNGKQQCNDKN